MAELLFIGLGLDDEQGLSRRALDLLGGSEVFAEEYTAIAAPGAIDRLAADIHRRVTRLSRAELESEAPILAALGRSERVALVVVGDPFAATTHVSLRLAVEKAGHRWRYLPNASVLTAAAGYLGLMHYRFGRPVSLPFPAPGWDPTSPVERIAANRAQGLHTLLLLDLRTEEGRFLTAQEALGALRTHDPDAKLLTDDDVVAVAARVGRDDAAGYFGRFARLRRLDFGRPMHCVVVPAPALHFEEAAALERFRVD